MTLPELFNHEDTAQLTAMIKDVRKHITRDFNASHLLKQLDNVQKPFSTDHWRFSSPAVMLGLALLLAVVAAVMWKKCCAQASQTATVHIPNAQPVLQQPCAQPQPQLPRQDPPQPQVQQLQQQPVPQQVPPAYQQQNPTFNFSKPTAPVLIYT